MGQSYCYSIALWYTSSNLHIFFGQCEECEKPMWVWAILNEAQLDLFEHASCYWASWWAWAWDACGPWIGPCAWFGPRCCPSYKPYWDHITWPLSDHEEDWAGGLRDSPTPAVGKPSPSVPRLTVEEVCVWPDSCVGSRGYTDQGRPQRGSATHHPRGAQGWRTPRKGGQSR